MPLAVWSKLGRLCLTAACEVDNEQADIDLFNPNQIDASAPLAAGGTILSGIGSFADRRLRLRALASGDPSQSFFYRAFGV